MSAKKTSWRGLGIYAAFLAILIVVYWFFFRDSVPSAKAKADAPGGSGGSGNAGGGGNADTTNPFAAAGKDPMYLPQDWTYDYLNDGETVTIKGVNYTGTGLDGLTTFQRMQIVWDLIEGGTWFQGEQDRRKILNRIAGYYKKSEAPILIEKYKTQTGGRDIIDDINSEYYYNTTVFYYNMKDN